MTGIVATVIVVFALFPKSVGRHFAEIVAAYRRALQKEPQP